MAFTATQRAKIRTYLGFSAGGYQTDYQLEGSMDFLDTDPESSALVVALLTDIDGIKTKLIDAHKRLKAVQVGTINLDGLRTEIAGLRWEGMRLTGELSVIVGVGRQNNIFSSASANFNDDRNAF